jgi:hypothetical protein
VPVLTRNMASPVGRTVVPLDSNRYCKGLFQSVTSFHSTVKLHLQFPASVHLTSQTGPWVKLNWLH